MKYLKYLPVILWMVLIFYLSSRPDLPTVDGYFWEFLFKKSGHVFVYTVLCLLWLFTLPAKKSHNAIFYSFIYSFTDEIHQLFIPGRTGLLRDVYIDLVGIVFGVLLFNIYKKWQKNI